MTVMNTVKTETMQKCVRWFIC